MSSRLRRTVRRLAHPRSRRTRLWAGVYRGVFDVSSDPPDEAPSRRDAD